MLLYSDSEMEVEGEHYHNGVVEGSTARIMNGTYKHEEILQPDDNSIGNGITGPLLISLIFSKFLLSVSQNLKIHLIVWGTLYN